MSKPELKSVDDYIAAQPESAQPVLQHVRSVIRKALPAAEEVISYRIPAYKLHGHIVIYFAGWKQHYSLYPIGRPAVAAFKNDLAPYEVNNKGTARFPLSAPIPAKLIAAIAKYLAEEVVAKTKSALPKKRH